VGLERRMAKKVYLSSLRRDFNLVINPMVGWGGSQGRRLLRKGR
jgi:hypothetical protein